MTHEAREMARFINNAQRDAAVMYANRLEAELDAYSELEAAVRAWLTDFDRRYPGGALPDLHEISVIRAALAALDKARR